MDAIEQLKQDVREGRIGVDRLIDVIVSQQRQLESASQELKAARQRIEELEKKAQALPQRSTRSTHLRRQTQVGRTHGKSLSRRRARAGLSSLPYAARVAFGKWPGRS